MNLNSNVRIVSYSLNNEAICASAARMSTTKGDAYEIFEKARNNEKNQKLIENVLLSGHKSLIEHAVFSLAFKDVSVYVEQYLIECRLASFTVKSRRYVDFSDFGYHIPPDLQGDDLEAYKKYMDFLFGAYGALLENGVPKEDARFLLPYSFYSNFYCTLNARELIGLIRSIRFGRGRDIPELQTIAQELTHELEEIFPCILPELYTPPTELLEAPVNLPIRNSDSVTLVKSDEMPCVRLLASPSNPMELLETAYKLSYPNNVESFDISYILKSMRPRELEFLNYSFKISNLSLSGLTHLVRHRMQSIVVPPIQSTDFSKCIVPYTVESSPKILSMYTEFLNEANKLRNDAFQRESLARYSYYFALSGNVLDVMSSMNARELMLFVRLRSCNRAQWEIRDISIEMLRLLRESFPQLFSAMGPSCYITGTCPEGKLSCGMQNEIITKFRGAL